MAALVEGKNDLLTVFPEVANEWNYDKNAEMLPNMFTARSGKKVWWKCDKGHEWEAQICSRTNSHPTKCPYCTNHRVLAGYNDVETTHPELLEEWDYKKNSFSPKEILPGSHAKVWWICKDCGHEWETTVGERIRGRACPVCSRKRGATRSAYSRVINRGSIESNNPSLLSEWDVIKNTGISPDSLTIGSSKKVWWLCSEGHSWRASAKDRQTRGCPYCSNKKVLVGFNDLSSTNPKLAKEWNYEKNGNLTPESVVAGADTKVWWKCENGHEWEASIKSRNKRGCPYCSAERRSSFPEQALLFYLKQCFETVINRDRSQGMELDIYIPNIHTGIEYDGQHFHQDVQRDIAKNDWAVKSNITLIRIREPDCPQLLDNRVVVFHRESLSPKSLNSIIQQVLDYLSVSVEGNIDVDRDSPNIISQLHIQEKNGSLAKKQPALLSEWNYEKNGILSPYGISFSSMKVVWWKCTKCGYEWRASVNRRNRIDGTGCPNCAGKVVHQGENDLQTKYPVLMIEWDYEKNHIAPSDCLPFSSKKVWWKCTKGHEWQARIADRTRGKSCPYCSKKRVISGENDLKTVFPGIAKEWDYDSNGELKPENVFPFSNKTVFWRCSNCGQKWESKISYRTSDGRKCPYCSKRR